MLPVDYELIEREVARSELIQLSMDVLHSDCAHISTSWETIKQNTTYRKTRFDLEGNCFARKERVFLCQIRSGLDYCRCDKVT